MEGCAGDQHCEHCVALQCRLLFIAALFARAIQGGKVGLGAGVYHFLLSSRQRRSGQWALRQRHATEAIFLLPCITPLPCFYGSAFSGRAVVVIVNSAFWRVGDVNIECQETITSHSQPQT